jgi:hypothetical protein
MPVGSDCASGNYSPLAADINPPEQASKIIASASLDQSVLLDSATETEHPATGTGRRPFKFLRFRVIAKLAAAVSSAEDANARRVE